MTNECCEQCGVKADLPDGNATECSDPNCRFCHKPLVSKEMAEVLRDAGYPQVPKVGDYVWHPGPEKILRCVKTDGKGSDAEPKILRMPTQADAFEFIKRLAPHVVAKMRRDIDASLHAPTV